MAGSLDARARGVFDQVFDRSGADRALHIQQSCDGDATLRARVEALLAAAEKDDEFLREPTLNAVESPAQPAAGEQPGARIGPYTLVKLIGEGGFGSVFLARQSTPVQREVALKIIKAGMDTKQVIARFEAERQALALMEHPHIARVLEVGATDAGRPYFVMELVHGQPVTRYCDDMRLSVAQRLELFCDICGAVQHAHQKGVIHRDIKPSNVLATTHDLRPFCKIIDFGIAKATQPHLTSQSLLTESHQLIGTPDYMSPEQARGADIDTRSDLYSLGVLLYELLTGTTPFDARRLRESGYDGLRRILSQEEPPRPSHRLQMLANSSAQVWLDTPTDATKAAAPSSLVTDIAKGRRLEPISLTRALRGDLDWIVMTCLEKDRDRRYPTASALADDLGRYLRHQPVSATPPSAGYQLRKFVRRNRGAVVAGVVVAATLLIATGVSFTFALSEAQQRKAAELDRARAKKAEGEAKHQAARLEQVASFQEKQLSDIDVRSMGANLRADILQKARAAAERSKVPSDEITARVAELESLIAGTDFTGIALEALEANFFVPALVAIQRDFSDQPPVQARLLQTLASTLRELGLLEAADAPQQQALEIRRRVLGVEHPDTIISIMDLAALRQAQGKLADAETYFQEALEIARRARGNEDLSTLRALSGLGKTIANRGRLSEAERYWREALDSDRRVVGDDHEYTLISMNNIGTLLHRQGNLSEAERYYRDVLEKRRRTLGDAHPETLRSMNNLGYLLKDKGELEEAQAYLMEALATRRRILGDEHPDTLSSIANLGILLFTLGRFDAAEPHLLEALETCRRVLGDDHSRTLNAISNVGALFKSRGNLAAAERYVRESLERSRRVLGEGHPDTLISMNNMAWLLEAQGRPAEAEQLYREALDRHRRARSDEHPDMLNILGNLASLLLSQGRVREAVSLLSPAEPAVRGAFTGGNTVRLGRWLTVLGRARAGDHEFGTAEANLSEAHAILSDAQSATQRDRMEVASGLVELYNAWHAADPDKGYDAKAAEWRRTLEERQASTQPATP